MNKRIIFILLFSVTIIFAQNYQDCIDPLWYFQNIGSTNSALSNNTTTVSSEMTGLGSNPATLALHTNPMFGLSLRSKNMSHDSKFASTNGLINTNYNDSQLASTKLNGFSAIYPFPVQQGSLVLAFSYANTANYYDQADATGDFTYDNAPFTVDNTYKKSGTMNAYRLGFAVEFKKNLFIGTSINLYNGKQTQEYNYIDRDISDNFLYSTINKEVEVKPEYSGMNFNLGVLYVSGKMKFGLNLATPFNLSAKENYDNSEIWTYDDGEKDSDYGSDYIKYKIRTPTALSTGFEYNFGNIALLFDVKMQDWHNMSFDSDLKDHYYDDAGNLTGTSSTDDRIDSEIRNNLKTTLDYGVGLSTFVLDSFQLIVGHRIISRPYYDLPNDEKNVHLTGIGVNTTLMNNLAIGISYQFEFGKNTLEREYFEYPIYRKYYTQNFNITTSLIF